MELWGLRKSIYVWLILVVTLILLTAECRQPTLHRVGGGQYSWAPNFNFTNWSSHETFYVGDWLYFGFDRSHYSVLEVNKTGYDRCIENNFMTNITRGGRDVFNLTQARAYYFISGRGYCFKGMKVAINVQDCPPEDPAPALFISASPSNNSAQVKLLRIVVAVAWAFLFKFI